MTRSISHNYIRQDSSEIYTSKEVNTTALCNLSSFPRQGGSTQRQAFQYQDQLKDFFYSPDTKYQLTCF